MLAQVPANALGNLSPITCSGLIPSGIPAVFSYKLDYAHLFNFGLRLRVSVKTVSQRGLEHVAWSS